MCKTLKELLDADAPASFEGKFVPFFKDFGKVAALLQELDGLVTKRDSRFNSLASWKRIESKVAARIDVSLVGVQNSIVDAWLQQMLACLPSSKHYQAEATTAASRQAIISAISILETLSCTGLHQEPMRLCRQWLQSLEALRLAAADNWDGHDARALMPLIDLAAFAPLKQPHSALHTEGFPELQSFLDSKLAPAAAEGCSVETKKLGPRLDKCTRGLTYDAL